jgi:hypothetical protein
MTNAGEGSAGRIGADPATIATIAAGTLVDYLDPAIVIICIGATVHHVYRDIVLALCGGDARQTHIGNMIRDETMARDLIVLLRIGIRVVGYALIAGLGGTRHSVIMKDVVAL